LDTLLTLLVPLITFGSLALAIRNGPFRNRWWRGENVAGFALTVAWICFLVGFVGPMIVMPSANQGPLLGIFYTGPIGLLVGIAWALWHAARRRA
jgi:hypothetical protein